MRISEIQKKISSAIRNKLSQRDLSSLCSYLDISTSGSKRNIQDRLESFMHDQSYAQLVLIHNKTDEFVNKLATVTVPVSQISNENIRDINDKSSYQPDTLSDEVIGNAPINLKDEVTMIDRKGIVVPIFTNYNSPMTSVPIEPAEGVNERVHNVRIPNMLPHVNVQTSPFYCCAVCLHPLSLLIPHAMPNVNQNNKITSNSSFQFFLSDDVVKLITRNSLNLDSNKVDYKWQVLLKFVAIEPNIVLPTPGQSIAQVIPQYLTVTVNNVSTPLWEVLPSNCRTKDGKRHPKPVNVTDKLNFNNRHRNCFPQNISITWWQAPTVFQYYYIGVYLERKLSVKEILHLFEFNRHVNIRPIEDTLRLIKSKLNDPKYRNNDDDDDLVVSSVLPISLSCPVGRSRIEVPIRTLKCQHLQCFDAQLFLSMNERRSIWKCPVCDISATPKELFCDKYFQKILHKFKDNDEVNDINVNSDGSYVAVFKRTDDNAIVDKLNDVKKAAPVIDTMIVLDSDDDDDEEKTPQSSSSKDKGHKSHKSKESSKSSKDKSHSHKERTPRSNSSTESFNDRNRQSDRRSHSNNRDANQSSSLRKNSSTAPKSTSCSNSTSTIPSVAISSITQCTQQSMSRIIDSVISRSTATPQTTTSAVIQTSTVVRTHTAPIISSVSSNFVPLPFSLPPPLYTPTNIPTRTTISTSQLSNSHLTSQPQLSHYLPAYTMQHNVIPAPSAINVPPPSIISSLIQAPILTPMPTQFQRPPFIVSEPSSTTSYRPAPHFPSMAPLSLADKILIPLSVSQIPTINRTSLSTGSIPITTHPLFSPIILNQAPIAPASTLSSNNVSVTMINSNVIQSKTSVVTSTQSSSFVSNKTSMMSSIRVPISTIDKSMVASSTPPSTVTPDQVSIATSKSISDIPISLKTSTQGAAQNATQTKLSSSNVTLTSNSTVLQTTNKNIIPSERIPIVSLIRASIDMSLESAIMATSTMISSTTSISDVTNVSTKTIKPSTHPSISSHIQSQISDFISDSRHTADKSLLETNKAVVPSTSSVVVTSPIPATISSIINGESQKSNVVSSCNDFPALKSIINRPNIDIVRTLDDVVRTLATDNVSPPETSIINKNLITMPVCCPVIIVNQSSPLTPRKELINESTPESLDDQRELSQKEVIAKEVIVPQENKSPTYESIIETILGGFDSTKNQSVNSEQIIEVNKLLSKENVQNREMITESRCLTAESTTADGPIISIDLTSDEECDKDPSNIELQSTEPPIITVNVSEISPQIAEVSSTNASQNEPQNPAQNQLQTVAQTSPQNVLQNHEPISLYDAPQNVSKNIAQICPQNSLQNNTQVVQPQILEISSQKNNQVIDLANSSNNSQSTSHEVTLKSTAQPSPKLSVVMASMRALNSSNLKWCSVKDPVFRKKFINVGNINNRGNIRAPLNQTTQVVHKPVTSDDINRYLKVSVNPNLTNRTLSDLSSSEHSSPPTKQLRLTNANDGRSNVSDLQRGATKVSGNVL